MRDLFSSVNYTSGYIDVEVECPYCHKKYGLEYRFINPVLPKKVKCWYCDADIAFNPTPEEKKE